VKILEGHTIDSTPGVSRRGNIQVNMSAYTLFATAVGHCGIAWGQHGILAVQLPESNATATLSRLLRKQGGDATTGLPPEEVRRTIDDITALLDGERRDLRHARLDFTPLPAFFCLVYDGVRQIPPGQTLTYGEVAARCGDAGAARTVGQAMARNPFPIIVPCHRVMAAQGKTGGFSAHGGVTTKLRLLAIEGAGTLSLPW
jgi:methylated-DNA-[protein]-cysteine S-methyltransferase